MEPLSEEFTPLAGFDLADYWQAHTAQLQERLWQGEAEIRISSRGSARLRELAVPAAVIDAVAAAEPDTARGWRRAVVPIESLTHAEVELLRLGAEVEVLSPPELRQRMTCTAHALAATYG